MCRFLLVLFTALLVGCGSETKREPLVDFTIGPYPSAVTILEDSIDYAFKTFDTTRKYSHSAAQGYALMAAGSYLSLSLKYEISGSDVRRKALFAGALDEIDELRAASGKVTSGGPAFGLETEWDAFGDESLNPAYTAYAWQSGMAALGIAEVLRYAHNNPQLHADESARIAAAVIFLGRLVDYWTPYFETVSLDAKDGGYFWYSDQPADAIVVHNTTALLAMASDIYGALVGQTQYQERAAACARLLLARVSTTQKGGYSWNYAHDGHPEDKRSPEDVSHAFVTTLFMRYAGARGWWSRTDMQKVAVTLTRQVWAGNPARLRGYVDGSSEDAKREWKWTQPAVVGYAVHGDAPGGDPALFDYARSILLSSYLTVYNHPLEGAVVGVPQMLAIARMLEHRPPAFANDSTYVTVAGDADTERHPTGGVRFLGDKWAAPVQHNVAGLSLIARTAKVANANLIVDLPEGASIPIVVSITYSASADGELEQWNGDAFVPLTIIPRTAVEDDIVRWMRTTVRLDASRSDYQKAVDGTNVLLRFTSTPVVHRIEATRLP